MSVVVEVVQHYLTRLVPLILHLHNRLDMFILQRTSLLMVASFVLIFLGLVTASERCCIFMQNH